MSRARSLTTALSLPWRQKLVAAEAFFELARAAVLIKLPHRFFTRDLGTLVSGEDGAQPDAGTELADADRRLARQIGALTARVALRAPFRAVCLHRAIATRRMLRRRGLVAEVTLGVMPDKMRAPPRDDYPAHAWVHHGPDVISGGEVGFDGYVVLGRFR